MPSPFSFFANSTTPATTMQDESNTTGHGSHSRASVKTLRIELTHSEIVLVAGKPTVLEGVLYVTLNKSTKVKSLQLEFTGRSSVTWVDATMTKPGITFSSYSATAFVPVLRRHTATSPASRTYHRGARIISSLEDKVQYKISLPQVRVPHSTKIPLQVSITSPHSRIAVSVLQVGLWERAVYRADGRKRVDMRLVKIQKSEGWTLEDREAITTEAVTWNKVLLFDMPPMGAEINQCNPSADNGLMKVTHTLRFSILGTDGNKRFRVENEIDLKVLALEDEYPPETDQQDEDGEQGDPMNELPSYLTSFTTPRVSFDSEREMDSADDDLLRALIARIHLPTYAESEEDTNSRDPSRDSKLSDSRFYAIAIRCLKKKLRL
ncbi:hypothetical protein EDD11_008464 [Mortierella claussenii]|nr:hypothetical protein EDD11_008464 [Mortierella claussenii]